MELNIKSWPTIESVYPEWLKHLATERLFDPGPPLSSQLFEDAIEYINEHDWIKGAEADTQGRVCLRGAFGKAVAEEVVFNGQRGSITKYLDRTSLRLVSVWQQEVMELMGIDTRLYKTIPHWNDEPDRTKEQVIDALTLAAKTLRDRGL